MIRPRWSPRATATLANLGGGSRPARRLMTGGGSDEHGFTGPPLREALQPSSEARQASPPGPAAAPTTGQASHPLPRRRARPAAAAAVDGRESSLWISNPMFPPRQNVQNPKGTADSSLLMLVIDGLSPNIVATDFYRIAPNDLSGWQSAIKKVQQQRNPDTLEPLGRYLVTFGSGQAAASYRDRLVRLHKLNGFKLRSASGLWESSVPLSLRGSLASPPAVAEPGDAAASDVPGAGGVVDLANAFTLAPGSRAVLAVQRKRVTVARPWAKRLAGLVEHLGYGERPPVLMVEVYPPTLTAQELHRFICRDGQNRGLRWQVSTPQHLETNSPEPARAKAEAKAAGREGEPQNPSFELDDRDTREKTRGRFVLACSDEAEARRFQQSWNRRALAALRPRPARYIVGASIIHW
ncbi:hypothetical protein Trco_003524 [Trichoderma cornu-damae]|uniref:Uncharacterized protein n=1 Tax=Trichoderma cornu-damae TaxID=654480 RepID=A0A9P8QIV5_9HYPO|nr:hypothetical protein Trco_003524 [Trichoderma cornu-damae]